MNTKEKSEKLLKQYNHSVKFNRILLLLLLGAIYMSIGLGVCVYCALHIPTTTDIIVVRNTETVVETVSVIEEVFIPVEVPVEVDPPMELLPEYKFLATAYTSDPKENGGYGAVGCRDDIPLTEEAIAANLNQLPYGTRVYIEGVGERVVVDTASNKTITRRTAEALEKGAVGWIDIYMGDNAEAAHAWGVKVVTIKILEWGERGEK